MFRYEVSSNLKMQVYFQHECNIFFKFVFLVIGKKMLTFFGKLETRIKEKKWKTKNKTRKKEAIAFLVGLCVVK